MKVAWVRRMESRGIKNYPKRFQSAEGCYSHRAASHPGIRIKMAHKQFVGLTVPSDEQIYAVNGAVWQCPKAATVSVAWLGLGLGLRLRLGLTLTLTLTLTLARTRALTR